MSAFSGKLKELRANAPMRSFEVPEWGLTVYVGPLTIGQVRAYSGEDDPFKRACRLIQVRAKDAEGQFLFDEEDYNTMITVGLTDTVFKVAARIAEDDNSEDAGKN